MVERMHFDAVLTEAATEPEANSWAARLRGGATDVQQVMAA